MLTIHTKYRCNDSNFERGRALPVSFLVYHYVGAEGDAEANACYYSAYKNLLASAHYFVDHAPNAEIWSSVQESDTAWHCGRTDGKYRHPKCRNANSIGIEMCCHKDKYGNWFIDKETMQKAAELGRDIMQRYNIPISNVLRHYDVTGKLCPRPLIDEVKWAEFKQILLDGDEEMDISSLTDSQVLELANRIDIIRGKQKVSDWAKEAWEKAMANGIVDGTAPQNQMTREQAILILDRLGFIKEWGVLNERYHRENQRS